MKNQQSKISCLNLIPCVTFEGGSEFRWLDSKNKEHVINLNKRIFNKKIEYVLAMVNGFPQLVKRSLVDYSQSANPFVNALKNFKFKK